MKKALAIALLLAVVAGGRADVFSQAKGQAKRSAGQENATAGASPQAPQNNAPQDPVLAATRANIASLQADFAALNQSTATGPSNDERMALLNHLAAAAQGTKPSSATVQKLAGQLSTMRLGKKSMAPRLTILARDIHALFNGSHLTTAQQQTMLGEVKKICADAGSPADETDVLLATLQTIVAETK